MRPEIAATDPVSRSRNSRFMGYDLLYFNLERSSRFTRLWCRMSQPSSFSLRYRDPRHNGKHERLLRME